MARMIPVCVIIGAHGIRGDVKIKSLTATPSAFASYGPLTSADGRVFEISKSKPATDHFICTLKNVTDRDQSEALKGTELLVSRDKLPKLPDGEFYLSDLNGKSVAAQSQNLGAVIGFQNYGAGDLMELDGGLLIPVRFIETVDTAVHVNLPEGYLDEAEAP